MLSILCLKWGDKYGPEYVNRLYNQCKEFIKLDFNFYCATDNSKNLNSKIQITYHLYLEKSLQMS